MPKAKATQEIQEIQEDTEMVPQDGPEGAAAPSGAAATVAPQNAEQNVIISPAEYEKIWLSPKAIANFIKFDDVITEKMSESYVYPLYEMLKPFFDMIRTAHVAITANKNENHGERVPRNSLFAVLTFIINTPCGCDLDEDDFLKQLVDNLKEEIKDFDFETITLPKPTEKQQQQTATTTAADTTATTDDQANKEPSPPQSPKQNADDENENEGDADDENENDDKAASGDAADDSDATKSGSSSSDDDDNDQVMEDATAANQPQAAATAAQQPKNKNVDIVEFTIADILKDEEAFCKLVNCNPALNASYARAVATIRAIRVIDYLADDKQVDSKSEIITLSFRNEDVEDDFIGNTIVNNILKSMYSCVCVQTNNKFATELKDVERILYIYGRKLETARMFTHDFTFIKKVVARIESDGENLADQGHLVKFINLFKELDKLLAESRTAPRKPARSGGAGRTARSGGSNPKPKLSYAEQLDANIAKEQTKLNDEETKYNEIKKRISAAVVSYFAVEQNQYISFWSFQGLKDLHKRLVTNTKNMLKHIAKIEQVEEIKMRNVDSAPNDFDIRKMPEVKDEQLKARLNEIYAEIIVENINNEDHRDSMETHVRNVLAAPA